MDGGDLSVLSTDILLWIVRTYLTLEDEETFGLVCRAWRDLRDDPRMWSGARLGQVLEGTRMSRRPFRFFGVRTHGTEGHCCKVQFRGDRQIYAMKKARVYPKGEGVPYYMLREIEFLRGLNHPNVSMLKAVALSGSELFMFFPYAPRTLHEALNSPNEPHESGTPLPLQVTKRFLYQILQGVSVCHERGVLHRNIKPKHLLLYDLKNPSSSLYPHPTNWEKDPPINPHDLESCTVCLSDFALVRTSLQPLRRFTPEVVTLWYRAPEVLLGGQYFTSVDMWAVGCVFAEMLCGKPFFAGVCEVNQLFEIFQKVGTPTEESWPGFERLPNVSFKFPNWPRVGLGRFFENIDPATLDLLQKILEVDPSKRISAREALAHPYFDEEFLIREGIPLEEHRRLVEPTKEEFFAAETNQALVTLLPDREFGLANPKLLCRYLPNILQVERESFQVFFGNKPPPPSRLPQNERFETVQRLIEVVEIFEMSVRTEFLAIALMDRFLSKMPAFSTQHQLLGTTCLHIASKCEDVSYIGVADLINLPLGGAVSEDHTKLASRLLDLQERVLNALEFRLAIPTVLDFLHGFCFSLNLDQHKNFSELFSACSYFAELSLLDTEFVTLLPSHIAVGILVYASLFFDPLTHEQLSELIHRRADCPVLEFVRAFRAMAETHKHKRDTMNQVLHRRYGGKSGSVFTRVVKWEAYLAAAWSILVAKEELPFADTSFVA